MSTFLTSDVSVAQILLQGKNPGVVWEYTLPRLERKPDYSWGVVRSDCSAPCAGGERQPNCLRDKTRTTLFVFMEYIFSKCLYPATNPIIPSLNLYLPHTDATVLPILLLGHLKNAGQQFMAALCLCCHVM